MNYSGIRVAVLGASGFIGRWVARRLTQQNARVFLFVRDPNFAEQIFSRYHIRGEIIPFDLMDSDKLVRSFKKIRPSVVFNLAGYGVDPKERDEELTQKVNAYCIQSICDAVLRARDESWPKQSLIQAGSALEYGRLEQDLSEDSIPDPQTIYGKSKLAGTDTMRQFCKEKKLRGLTARLFTVYGPGEHSGRLLPSLLDAAESGKTLPLTAGTQMRDFTFVEDVAEGLLRLGLSKAEPGDIVNLATGTLTTVRRFTEIAADVLNIAPEKLLFGRLPVRNEEMHHLPVNIDRLIRLTSWSPTITLEDGIRKTVNFLSSDEI